MVIFIQKIRRSLTSIFLIILVFTNILLYLQYSIITRMTTSPCTTVISHDSCYLSLKESDNWFCDSDDDWNRRKHVHHIQDKRNRNNGSIEAFFIDNWEPTVHCTFERRIGNVGDGGKWVCDIHKLQTDNSMPLVYSLGSNGDFSFERSVKEEFPKAEIHTFDLELYVCPDDVCTFHQAFLGDGKDNTKPLHEIINELGHRQRQIYILKVDIEASEYIVFEEFFKHTSSKESGNEIPYIRQILIEVHILMRPLNETVDDIHHFFELFRSNKYAIFHKEANLYAPGIAPEYAFIRLNPAFFM